MSGAAEWKRGLVFLFFLEVYDFLRLPYFGSLFDKKKKVKFITSLESVKEKLPSGGVDF